MTETTQRSVRGARELLDELVELVETARAVPLSGSCVVPRERALDLLDAVHDAIPAELTEARAVLARREALLAEAERQAAGLVAEAEVRAHETVEAGQAEHAGLVSASRVHQTAAEHAAALRADAESFADRTLADLVAVLQQAMETARQGRQALASRRADDEPAEPPISG
jgi:cell division septum initiation protein DivIVA